MTYKITLKERKGKDFFQHLEMTQMSEARADEAAIASFVLVNGKPIDLDEVMRLKEEVFVKLTAMIFAVDEDEISDDYEIISYKNYEIKRRRVTRDSIYEIKAMGSELGEKRNKKKITHYLKQVVSKLFEVTPSQLDEMDYMIVSYLIDQTNQYLRQIGGQSVGSSANFDSIFASE